MSLTEYRTHMSLWALLAAPLLAGNDLRTMTPEIRAILTNRDVIAVDQDPLGKQGKRVWQHGTREIWVKPLSDGSSAVGVFERGDQTSQMPIDWNAMGLSPRRARDLWTARDVAPDATVEVPAHGVVLLRIWPK
jgi:alpha-galactosidase